MFGQLQVKSAYSFQKSTILINDLVKMAKEKHLDAIALCDEDHMYGAFEFFEACTKAKIKPIFGVEATIAINEESYPFTLLALDDQGYVDLIKIVSDINLAKERRLPIHDLVEKSAHLIVISASPLGIVESYAAKEMEGEALKYLKAFKKSFPHYYLMIQDHGLEAQKFLNRRLVSMASLAGVKVICGNDVCYLRKQDALAVDLLEASGKNVTLDVRHEPKTSERYLKDEREMAMLFDREIMDNTREVVTICKATIPLNQKNLPYYPMDPHIDKQRYLRELCGVGLKKRFNGQPIPDAYKKRLSYELSIIHMMGFDDYFLIVWDYVTYAKKNGILVGPGRGSAAGSLVAYVLGITNVDPLVYDLLFERFLNPERVSMPDIDVDFQDDRRDEVVAHVLEKYGTDHVCQIVTFNTYGPRVAIKDIGKVMNIPLKKLEIVAKNIPTGKNGKTITQMYESSASFQEMINRDPALRRLIGPMSLIEHLPRNISMHAAGVVMSTRPLDESVPLVIGPSQQVMSQYSKDYIEKAGLIKMDFLGLRNLTMISYILKDIEIYHGFKLNLNNIPLDDAKTYQMLSRGETFGVFQLESSGMRSLIMKMKPNSFHDIVDAIALYRPGPMENIPLYLRRRAGQEKIDYIVPALKPILSSTYGIIIYQEQIMQIAQVIANFSLGKADMIRKAVSKKKLKDLERIENDFISGAIQNGYSEQTARQIYDLILKFANYGFNKSHSVAYGMISYDLAYLKANEPLYFFASILSNEAASSASRIRTIEEAKRYRVNVLRPDINASIDRFKVEEDGIRYSLTAIKNVGLSGYREIAKEKQERGPFKDLIDFFMRMRDHKITIKMIESLIDAGAFDSFSDNRAFMKKNIPVLENYADIYPLVPDPQPPVFVSVPENRYSRLENEKAVLGLYLSTHPIAMIKESLHHSFVSVMDVAEHINQTIDVLVNINAVRIIVDKRGKEMAFVDGSDETGSEDFVCFASQYTYFRGSLKRGKIVAMNVRVSQRDRLSLIINQVKDIK
jgi:DNA polymerase-3 subunit alpha